MATQTHYAEIGLYWVDSLGNIINKNNLRLSGTRITYNQEYRITPNPNIPNSLNYPKVKDFILAEANDDFIISYYDNQRIITSFTQTLIAPVLNGVLGADPTTEIDLTWTSAGSSTTGYKIERSEDGGAWVTLVADTGTVSITYTDSGLTPGGTYAYRVYGLDGATTGPVSNSTGNIVTDSIPEPDEIFGALLKTWIDPSDAATVTESGGSISEIADKAGTFDFVGTARSATYDTSTFALPTMRFATPSLDGDTGQWLNCLTGSPLDPTGDQACVWIVGAHNSSRTHNYTETLAHFSLSAANFYALYLNPAAAGDPFITYDSVGPDTLATTVSGFTEDTLFVAKYKITSISDRRVYLDGGGEGTDLTDKTGSYPGNFTNMAFGARQHGGSPANYTYLDGWIGEFAIVVGAFTAEQESDMDAYLSAKLGTP